MARIARIYVSSSVIGGCFDEEFAQWSRKLLDEFRIGARKAVVSFVTAGEMEQAPEEVREEYQELLDSGAEFLPLTGEAFDLADRYVARGVLSRKAYNDGLHVALATIAVVDMLVSWNFRHIVNFQKIRGFNAVNIEIGYKPVEIYSPLEVVGYED